MPWLSDQNSTGKSSAPNLTFRSCMQLSDFVFLSYCKVIVLFHVPQYLLFVKFLFLLSLDFPLFRMSKLHMAHLRNIIFFYI